MISKKLSLSATLLLAAPFLALTGLSAQAGSTVKTIYVHGFHPGFGQPSGIIACHGQTTGTCDGNWVTKYASDNAIFVGYDGRIDPISTSNSLSGTMRLLDVLNKHCRKDQGKQCRIINHSMGGLVTANVISKYAAAYNINYVVGLASAQGGSVLAEIATPVANIVNVVGWALSIFGTDMQNMAVYRLRRDGARLSFNHYASSVLTYHISSNKDNFFVNAIQKGSNDTVVEFQSQCAYPAVEAFSQCGGETIKRNWYCIAFCKYDTHAPYASHRDHPNFSRTGVQASHRSGESDALTRHSTYHRVPGTSSGGSYTTGGGGYGGY